MKSFFQDVQAAKPIVLEVSLWLRASGKVAAELAETVMLSWEKAIRPALLSTVEIWKGFFTKQSERAHHIGASCSAIRESRMSEVSQNVPGLKRVRSAQGWGNLSIRGSVPFNPDEILGLDDLFPHRRILTLENLAGFDTHQSTSMPKPAQEGQPQNSIQPSAFESPEAPWLCPPSIGSQTDLSSQPLESTNPIASAGMLSSQPAQLPSQNVGVESLNHQATPLIEPNGETLALANPSTPLGVMPPTFSARTEQQPRPQDLDQKLGKNEVSVKTSALESAREEQSRLPLDMGQIDDNLSYYYENNKILSKSLKNLTERYFQTVASSADEGSDA